MDALDRTIQGREQRPAGMIGAYGWIYTHWLSVPDNDPTAIFAELLREHAVFHDIVAPQEPILGGSSAGTISLHGLANQLGMGFERTRRIVVAAGALQTTTRRGVAASIPAAIVAELDARSAKLLSVRQTENRLGVGKRIVCELAEAGILNRDANGMFDRAEVDALASRLVGFSDWRGQMVSLTGLARSGVGSVTRLCEEVLDGKIRAAGLVPDPVRLTQVGLCSADAAFLKPGGDLTIRAIARKLGLREDVTRHLAEVGALSDVSERTPTPRGIELFAADFVTTVEIAGRFKLSARAVWTHLNDIDVSPAFGPPSCRQLIYRRDVAEQAIWSRPGTWCRN